jgi:hypothetical protein
MVLNKLAFTALGAACIIAASAGGYVALRQNATSTTEAVDAGPAESVGAQAAPTASPSGRPAPQPETLVSRTLPAEYSVTAPAPAKSATPIVTAAPKRAAKPEPVLASRTNALAPSDRPWSNAAASAPTPLPTPVPQTSPEPAASSLRPGETVIVAQDPTPLPEPAAQKSYEELVVSADSVIGLQSETSVSSERARVEDRVEARVTRDVRVGNRVAIPAGSRAIGVVSQVERGGKFKEHAKLAIRFQTVVLADGTRLPISTDAVIREGAPSDESAKKIGGGAVAGTILGAILGGAKGAAIGGMAGAGAGAGVVAAGDRAAATLHAGEPITIRLLSPVTITSER